MAAGYDKACGHVQVLLLIGGLCRFGQTLLQGMRAALPGMLGLQSLLACSSLGLCCLRGLLLPCQLSLEVLLQAGILSATHHSANLMSIPQHPPEQDSSITTKQAGLKGAVG